MSTAVADSDQTLTQLVNTIKPRLWRAGQFSAVASLLMLTPSIYMLEVYDRVVNSRSLLTLWMLTLALLVSLLLMELLEWIRTELLFSAGLEADSIVAPKLVRVMLHSRAFGLQGGNLQPLQDWKTLREFLGSPVIPAVMETPASLIFLLIVFALHPLLGWATFFGGVLQLLITVRTERATQPALDRASRNALAAQQFFETSARNAEVISAMGMIQGFRNRWAYKQNEFLTLQSQASHLGAFYQALSRWLQLVLGSGLLGIGAWLTLRNQLPGGAGMMIVASIIGGRALAPLVVLITQWKLVVGVRLAWVRVNNILATDPAKEVKMPLPKPKGRLNVERAFVGAPRLASQPEPVPILKGVQFELHPGEVLAVVGPSASGKTTLARALVGLWPTISGKVRLDGVDVSLWDKGELGPHLGYMPHDIQLFEGSFAENVARFGSVDIEEVVRVSSLVGLHGFISAQRQGYDTSIGTEGCLLSGGQRQRLGLARALYGRPQLVVLDEPNSNLDSAGEEDLLRALRTAKAQGSTIVVMTHRRGVLAVADKLLILRDGIQQGFGPKDEVLAALEKAAKQSKVVQAPVGAQPTAGA